MENCRPEIRVGHLTESFFNLNRIHYYDALSYMENNYPTMNYVFTYKHLYRKDFPFPRVYAFHSLPFLRKNLYRLYGLMRGEDFSVPYWSKVIEKEKIQILHNYFAWTGAGAVYLKEAHKIPLCVTIGEDEVQLSKQDLEKRGLKKLFGKIFREADTILATSYYVKNCLLRHGAPIERVGVWHPGIDTSKFGQTERMNHRRDVFRVITVARMVAFKGLRYLLQAIPIVIRENPKVMFIFVGSGPQMELLKSLCNKLNIQNYVSFLGFLPHSKVIGLYTEMDLFVLPSIILDNGISETLGVVLLEAQASYLPVVATNVGGIPEVVASGRSGLLVEPRNPEQLANAISQLLSNNQLRKQMGNLGRRFVEENFDIKKRTAKLFGVYRRLSEN